MDYEHQKMLTCIGNKRSLVKNIEEIVEKDILTKLKKDKINILDGFLKVVLVVKKNSKSLSTRVLTCIRAMYMISCECMT